MSMRPAKERHFVIHNQEGGVMRTSAAALLYLSATLSAHASDKLLDLESRKGDVTVMYERKITSFDELQRLRSSDLSSLDIVVYPATDSPSAAEYEVAKAYADALKETFPRARFTTSSSSQIGADYFVAVQAFSGREVSEGTKTVYGSRSTAVTCSDNFGNSVTCRETGSVAVPVGTRSVQLVDRYVDVVITFARAIFHGSDNPRIGSDGSRIVWEAAGVAKDDFTIAYDAGACDNDAAASATLAAILGSDSLADRPRKFKFNSKSKTLRCNDR